MGVTALDMHALDALGNPVRRAILASLRETALSPAEIAERFPVTRPAISRHLRILMEGGLVEMHTESGRNRYAIRVEGFQPVREYLDSFWDVALTRLREMSRR